MDAVRALVSRALQAREKAGMKLRQPLRLLKVPALPKIAGLADIIAEEVNVKAVEEDSSLGDEVWIDTELTPELREEAKMRELVRRIQQWRKDEGYSIADRPRYTLTVTSDEKVTAEKYKKEIMAEAGLADVVIVIGTEA